MAERIDRRSIVHFGPAGDCVLLVCWFFLSSGSDDGSSIHAGRKSQLSDAIAEHRIPRNHFRFDPILRMLIVPDTVSCFYFDNPTQPTPIGSFMSSLVPFSAACPRTSMRSVVFECFFGSLLFFSIAGAKKNEENFASVHCPTPNSAFIGSFSSGRPSHRIPSCAR